MGEICFVFRFISFWMLTGAVLRGRQLNDLRSKISGRLKTGPAPDVRIVLWFFLLLHTLYSYLVAHYPEVMKQTIGEDCSL